MTARRTKRGRYDAIINLHLTSEMHQRLSALAEREERSLAGQLRLIVTQALERAEGDS